MGVYKFFIGWLLIIGLFYGLSKFETGQKILYYMLWLSVILVLVAYQEEIMLFIKSTGIAINQPTTPQPAPQPAPTTTPPTVNL